MDLMSNSQPFHDQPNALGRMYSLDMAVAAQTSLSVLISAPAQFALPIAIEIARGGAHGREGIVVVDAADDRDVQSALIRAASADSGQLRAVVVQDVDALDRAQQSTIMALVTDLGRPGARPCRIISTTSVPLFERVRQGSFEQQIGRAHV